MEPSDRHREAAHPPLHPLLDRQKVDNLRVIEERHSSTIYDLVCRAHQVGVGRREGLVSIAERPRLDELPASPIGRAQPDHALHFVLQPAFISRRSLKMDAQLEHDLIWQQVQIVRPRVCTRAPLAGCGNCHAREARTPQSLLAARARTCSFPLPASARRSSSTHNTVCRQQRQLDFEAVRL